MSVIILAFRIKETGFRRQDSGDRIQETGDRRQEIIFYLFSPLPHYPTTPLPYTPHPTPHTLHPTPYTLHPTSPLPYTPLSYTF
ncbi:hypothetical protein O53_80 [Microcystis aeruginosa TAIHU98]|uniref:Uncharacterized protein n=1 Tax=Microcystis aeruginosa TAIHU98 TaxID=1134457 RepID=L7E9Y6_MICAE|nr:hypothetical protein O53_80 [Microcystis aeruginosa TAIHU98]